MSTATPLTRAAHTFVRNPNLQASHLFRNHTRDSAFDNTLKVLEDPANGRKLYLIGSTHANTILANRTKSLVNDVKPDSLLVQTNQKWWNMARHVNATTQKQMDTFTYDFQKCFPNHRHNNFRGLMFKARLYSWLWSSQLCMAFPDDFHPFTPGLEMKYAIEEANNHNANVHFAGLA